MDNEHARKQLSPEYSANEEPKEGPHKWAVFPPWGCLYSRAGTRSGEHIQVSFHRTLAPSVIRIGTGEHFSQ